MAEQKQRKHWQDMTFRELDNKALIEHAKSLGGKKAVERRLKSIENQTEGPAQCSAVPALVLFCLGLFPLFKLFQPYRPRRPRKSI